jgi:predicted XRE-type DNA-binding protein
MPDQAYPIYKACRKKGRPKEQPMRCKTATKRKQAEDEKIERSSGNVFADLRFADAQERMLKAQLAAKIAEMIRRKGWTQARAAEVIGLDQPKVSHLLRGRLSGFSAERLFAILNRLGHSVEVRISAKERAPGKTGTCVILA